MAATRWRHLAAARRQRTGVTGRAVLLGIGAAASLAWITPYNDVKVAATFIGGNQFPVGALFSLLMLALGFNTVLRKVRPQAAFTPGEMLTVWALILVASGIPSGGLMRFLLPHIIAPQYHSNSVNNWEEKIWGEAPGWLKIQDPVAVQAFYEGYPRGEERIPWEAWASPLFFWGVLVFLFLLASFSVAAALRRQWVMHEKFAFPLVVAPLLLAEEPESGRLVNPLLRNPLLWTSVGLMSVLHSFKGLHLLYPSIPDIVTSYNLQEALSSPLSERMDWFPLNFHPLMVGLTYLLPREVAFSFWFFFLFYKFQILLCSVYNWQMPASLGAYGYKLFHALQSFGGALALCVWVGWTGRQHFRDILEKAFGGPRAASIEDREEMASYRQIVAGLVISYGGIILWLYLAGVTLSLIVLSLVMMTLALVVISWMVCQAGMLFVQTAYGTIDIIAPVGGTAGLDLTALHTQYRFEGSFFYNTREMMIPSVLQGAKAAERAGFSARRLTGAMAMSVFVTVIVSAVAFLKLPYDNGGANAIANDWVYNAAPTKPLQLLGGMASVPYVGSWTNLLHILAGFVGVLALLMLRAYWGWGLHPIGFLGASVHATHALWFSMFLGWLFKSLILRYGGMSLYQRLLPAFIGLIVADVVNGALWILLGNLTGTGYRILP